MALRDTQKGSKYKWWVQNDGYKMMETLIGKEGSSGHFDDHYYNQLAGRNRKCVTAGRHSELNHLYFCEGVLVVEVNDIGARGWCCSRCRYRYLFFV